MSIADRITVRMKDLNLSNYSLAKRSGISEPQIGRILKATNEPKEGTIHLIAKALEVSPDYLKYGTIDNSVNEPNTEYQVTKPQKFTNPESDNEMKDEVMKELIEQLKHLRNENRELKSELKACKESDGIYSH